MRYRFLLLLAGACASLVSGCHSRPATKPAETSIQLENPLPLSIPNERPVPIQTERTGMSEEHGDMRVTYLTFLPPTHIARDALSFNRPWHDAVSVDIGAQLALVDFARPVTGVQAEHLLAHAQLRPATRFELLGYALTHPHAPSDAPVTALGSWPVEALHGSRTAKPVRKALLLASTDSSVQRITLENYGARWPSGTRFLAAR